MEMIARTSKLLRLTPSIICHKQCPVILHQCLLQLILCVFVHVFLVVGNDGFGNGLTDGVDLGGMATTVDPDTDVDIGEFVETDYKKGFVDLKR